MEAGMNETMTKKERASGDGPVNEYGYPLGGCYFGTMVAGRSAHSHRCACANCRMWSSWKGRQERAKRNRRVEKARAKRAKGGV
jgi:hypothetical protein